MVEKINVPKTIDYWLLTAQRSFDTAKFLNEK